jgi:hypothetical protein
MESTTTVNMLRAIVIRFTPRYFDSSKSYRTQWSYAIDAFHPRSRKLLSNTLTELKAIAAAAIHGVSIR